MKRLARGLVGVILLVIVMTVALVAPAVAQNTSNFTISSFTADYYLGRTAQNVPTMQVNEVIVAQFPAYSQNHGILRALPSSYKGQPLDIAIESITDAQGQAYPYTTSNENGNVILKIGNPDTYVTGEQTYQVAYNLKNEISFWPDHDELYWNVNGTQWQQSFGAVTARVHIPAELAGNLQDRQVCYAGSRGSGGQNCTISRTDSDGGVLVTATAQNLGPQETLTYVLGFAAGTFAKDAAAARAKVVQLAFFAGFLIGLPLVALAIAVHKWRIYGRDPRGKGTIIPEYIPPKDLNVLTSDVVLHEQLRTPAITALIIELAIKHCLALYETQKSSRFGRKSSEYSLELLQMPGSLTTEEQSIMSMLFPDGKPGDRVELTELKNFLYKEVAKLNKSVPQSLFEAGYFKNDPVKARNAYYLRGGLLLGVTGFATIFAAQLWWPLAGLTGGLALSGLVMVIVARTMPARSQKGVEARDYLRGLEMYMKLAEADRINYLQSPEGVRQWGDPADPKTKIKLFEKLLPYAMIFGIEKDWAKQFKDIYHEPPDWYHGNWTTFSTVYLVSSLNSFGTANATSFAAPGSSGSSGFGGGGFAGGGGGGGGGGGW